METNQTPNRGLLSLDFIIQCGLLLLNTLLLLGVILGLIIGSERFATFGIFLLYLQLFTGFYQFLGSALPRVVMSYNTISTHRKIHFFTSLFVVFMLFLSFQVNNIDLGGLDRSRITWVFMWANILVFPQILMYYYGWITWKEYKS